MTTPTENRALLRLPISSAKSWREDVQSGKHSSVHTRFPPEPNGYLHIGHAKAICLSFGIAREFGGICNVRMDDTNPAKEEAEYVESIMADVQWLIGGWAEDRIGLKPAGKTPEKVSVNGREDFQIEPVVPLQETASLAPFFASDYFDQIYAYAVQLTRDGKAYVCDMTPEQTDEYRRIGKESPFRDRTAVEENLDLLRADEGGRVSRWRADVAREDRHVVAEHLAARSRCSIASGTSSIITPARTGASIRCTTSRIA